ncbi:MAG: 2-C-methyl-D-erythritol 2,4-cyclodiphosphate synthase [Terriglobales bacterium]
MKHQFFADRNDYFKYDLLSDVLEGLPLPALTFVPMLTPDDGKGGQRVRYPQGKRRRDLHDFLQACIRENRRDINELSSFFAKYTDFHLYRGDQPDFTKPNRSEYFQQIPQEWLGNTVVFFDPDVGLEAVSKRGSKHLRFDELKQIVDRMSDSSAVVVIQFPPFVRRKEYLDKVANRLLRETRLAEVHYVSDGTVGFFAGSKCSLLSTELVRILANHAEKHDLPVFSSVGVGGVVKAEDAVGTDMRIGYGFDSHSFRRGLPLKIGGVRVPHTHGLAGHSDGDVLLHALTDALLGAVAAGDIGSYFPPSNKQWKGADSVVFVREALRQVARAGYRVGNVDSTLVMEKPRIGPYASRIQSSVAELLGIPASGVGIKAKTPEGLGTRNTAMAHVVVLLEKRPKKR